MPNMPKTALSLHQVSNQYTAGRLIPKTDPGRVVWKKMTSPSTIRLSLRLTEVEHQFPFKKLREVSHDLEADTAVSVQDLHYCCFRASTARNPEAMGRDLQKKKRRSSRPTIRQANRLKRPLNPRGNALIAKNWNKKETLAQNYRRLGLVPHLKPATGGSERRLGETALSVAPLPAPLTVAASQRRAVREARVERDADGRILRVEAKTRPNPLGDALVEFETDDEEEAEEHKKKQADGFHGQAGEVIRGLEREAARTRAQPSVRTLCQREREWLCRLVDRYGDDAAAMARDRKMNPMQQTTAAIAKQLRLLESQKKA